MLKISWASRKQLIVFECGQLPWWMALNNKFFFVCFFTIVPQVTRCNCSVQQGDNFGFMEVILFTASTIVLRCKCDRKFKKNSYFFPSSSEVIPVRLNDSACGQDLNADSIWAGGLNSKEMHLKNDHLYSTHIISGVPSARWAVNVYMYGPRFHLRIRSTNLTSCWSISLGRHWLCVYTILGFSPSLAPFCIWCPEVYWNKHIFNSIQFFICWDWQQCCILTLRLTERYLLLGSWTWLNFLHLLVKSSAHSFADISALFHSEVKINQKWW